MKILYQPAQANPGDWQESTPGAWAGLGEFDINALNVQGLVFEGADRYGVLELPGNRVQVAVAHDDPVDWPEGLRWARMVTFHNLGPSSDARLGGAITTQQSQVLYAEDGVRPILDAAYAGVAGTLVKPWSSFNPSRYASRNGKWLSNALYEAHTTSRAVRGWREWTDGVSALDLNANGLVKDQRRLGRFVVPKGTRTYYHNPVAGPAIHNPNTVNSLALTPSGVNNQSSGNVGANGVTAFEAMCPANEPNSAAWPTVMEIRYQLDVPTAGSDLTFGLLDQGTLGVGGFMRVNAAADTLLQMFAQDNSAFSGSGLHLATLLNAAWTAGSATDRYGILVGSVRVLGHGNQTFVLQTGELDDFTDGGWASALGGSGVAAMGGFNF